MLTYLSIENVALIAQAEIEFGPGLTVITGETGAGKSILIDAIEIIMGKKADASLIRQGHDKACLSAIFDVHALPDAKTWLLAHELLDENDNECSIARIINRQGRQRYSINGTPVPQQKCRDLAPRLLNILGQHQAQHLLRQNDCYAWLDDFAGLQERAQQVRQCYQAWANLQKELTALKDALQQKHARFDLLQYQVSELNQFTLTPAHLKQLNETHARMGRFEQLQASMHHIANVLGEAEQSSILQNFYQINQLLDDHINVDAELKPLKACIEQALPPTEEAFATARDYCAHLSFDSEAFATLEDELSRIHQLARKHRVREEELPALKQRLVDEFDNLSHSDEKIEALTEQLSAAANDYHTHAKALSKARLKAAKQLAQQVTRQIQQLGMPHAQFKVACEPRINAALALHPHGLESVQFQIMTNPGQPWQPLGKIASGGELSRIHLAMNVEIKHLTHLPTLICDEVDTGIGGQTSHLMGKLLRQLGEQQQVLAVTHLAPIAAMGQAHFHVAKTTEANQTFTRITTLNDSAKCDEIARMLGGKTVTTQTRALAKELLEAQ